MSGKFIFLLSVLCACAAAGRGHALQPSGGPIGAEGSHPRPRPRRGLSESAPAGDDGTGRQREGGDDSSEGSAPETVLSVHYDRGLIKNLFLSQTRGRQTENTTWNPSVYQKRRICQDLCQAGLGGDPCGFSCEEATPDVLETQGKKQHRGSRRPGHSTSPWWNTSDATTVEASGNDGEITGPGTPRTDVCPILCANGLGMPLCICMAEPFMRTTWSTVCEGFCKSDSSYQLKGCPACEVTLPSEMALPQRSSQPSDFWVDWCKGQCKIGEGGAACKCDLAPMSL